MEFSPRQKLIALALIFVALLVVSFWIFKTRNQAPKEIVVVVTIPEGFSREEAGDLFASKLIRFNKENFLNLTLGKEGYLFPDTYNFFELDDENDAVRLMSENYEKKVAPLRPDIMKAGRKEKDIIIMASIIEGEAKGEVDRAMISGILWKRIALGVALGVDAAPSTYDARGLPGEAIGNPGLAAIRAAIFPQKSDYLYYLHDEKGNIHYARNFEEHKANKAKYLN